MRAFDKPINGVIYKTTNLVNGKWYIGKDENNNPDYLGSGISLSRAIAKYGKHNFRKEILAEAASRQELVELEKKFIKEYRATESTDSYNIASGGYGGNTIAGYDESQRSAFAEVSRQRWKTYTPEQRALIVEKQSKANKGKKTSAETKAKISAAKTGIPRSPEAISKIRDTMREKYASGKITVPRHSKKYSEDEMRKMKQAYDNGTPVSELQKIYKLSRTTIYKYLR